MTTIPEKVNEVLKVYFNLFEYKFPTLLESYHIYGSISLGAFKYGSSDIDFIAILTRRIAEDELNLLKEIHANIKEMFPEIDLMGFYITQTDLLPISNNEKSCACFIDGVFHGFMEFDKNSIDAYQLQRYGITVKGEKIDNYNFTIDWYILLKNMIDNLNSYWFNRLTSYKKFPSHSYLASLLSLKEIEWGVLGVSRIYYTINERDIKSKVGAGEYALETLPEKWHKIINESMRLRKGNKKSYYKSMIMRRKDAIDYMKFIIQESNRLYSISQ